MGLSWYHTVHVVCDEDQTGFTLPERVNDVPVYDLTINNNIISFTSGGYGLFDLFTSDFPLPSDWKTVSHRMYGCQGQDFDVVDWVGKDEIDDQYEDVAKDENDEYEYEPGLEYTDPTSDYWTEGNDHLNVYNQTPDINWDDDDYEEQYDQWVSKMNEQQEKDLIKGLSIN